MIAYDYDKLNDKINKILNFLVDSKDEENDFIDEFKSEIIKGIAYIYADTNNFKDFVERLSVYINQLFEE